MKIPKEKLPNCHIQYPEDAEYIIEEIPARALLSAHRMDFYAKLLYIDHFVKDLDMSYARQVYLAQVRAVTGNTNSEKGNPQKDTGEKFITVFNKLIEDISKNGFDSNISLIPVDADGYVVDGAHRVSIAAYFNKTVTIIRFKEWRTGYSMNWEWLEKQLLPSRFMDAIALECCNWHDNLYMACLWPQSFVLTQEREKAFEFMKSKTTFFYRKKISLNRIGLRNFLMQIYGHMDWIGDVNNHYAGVIAKLKEVEYKGFDNVEFCLLQADSFDTVFNMKKEVRDIFNIGLSSIHITDNIRETKQIADLIFNPNSFHHLTHSYPDKFLGSYKLMLDFKKIISDNNLNWRNYVLDSSMVMAIYGIREAGDLDYLTTDKNQDIVSLKSYTPGLMEPNDKYLDYHSLSVKDMVCNPANYFIFNEIKFLTLKEIKYFKTKKGEIKDKNDVKLISAYVENDFVNHIKMFYLNFKHNYLIYKQKLFQKLVFVIVRCLKTIGLFNFCKKIYKMIR